MTRLWNYLTATLTAHRLSGLVFSGMAAIAVGFITMTSFMIVFPGAGLPLAIAVFFAGCFVEVDVYLPNVVGGFKNLLFKWGLTQGLFKSLEYAMTKIAIREHYYKNGAKIQVGLKRIVNDASKHAAFLNAFGFATEMERMALAKLSPDELIEAFLTQLQKKNITLLSADLELEEQDRALANQLLELNNKLSCLMTIADDLDAHKEFLKALGFKETEISALKELKATQLMVALLNKMREKKITSLAADLKISNEARALGDELLALQKHFNGSEFQKRLYHRKIRIVFAFIAALGTGIAFGAITFTHVSSQMIMFAGLGALTAAPPVWIIAAAGLLAGFSAVAYFLMMYYTLAKAIEGDFFKQLKEKLYAVFAPKKELKTGQDKLFYAVICFFKALALAAVMAACVLVTMATGDAWFNSSERFFAMLGSGFFDTIPLYATIVSYFLVWAMFVPITTMFSMEASGNSLEAMSEAFSGLRAKFAAFYSHLQLRWQKETILQFFNPFRLLAAVLENMLATAILGAHVGVSGVLPGEGSSENGFMSKFLTPWWATGLGSGVELTVDADYVLGGDHDHHHDHDDHNHDHEHSHHHAHKDEHAHLTNKKPKLNKNNLGKGMAGGHNHDHNHGLTAQLVKVIIFIPKYVGFLWDNATTREKRLTYAQYQKRRYKATESVSLPRVASHENRMGKGVSDAKIDSPVSSLARQISDDGVDADHAAGDADDDSAGLLAGARGERVAVVATQ